MVGVYRPTSITTPRAASRIVVAIVSASADVALICPIRVGDGRRCRRRPQLAMSEVDDVKRTKCSVEIKFKFEYKYVDVTPTYKCIWPMLVLLIVTRTLL